MDMKPPGKRKSGGPRTRWMDAADTVMKSEVERKMTMTEDDGEGPSMTIATNPDDGTSRKKSRRRSMHVCSY